MPFSVRMGIRVKAPREYLFQHLLTPHHLARWYCNFAQFDPRGPAVGTKFRFGGDYAIAAADPPGWECEIEGGEVLRSVTFRWPLLGSDTRVEWRAEDAAEGSVLRVVHTGLPREDATCGGFREAWRICLGNLKAITEARDDSLRPDSSPIREPLRLDLLVAASPSRTFGALTDPAQLRAWAGGEAAVEPRAGGAYGLQGPGGVEGRIEKIEPGRLLVIAWPAEGEPTQATLTLEDKGGGRSGLYLAATGLAVGDPTAALGLRCGWTDRLVGLKNYLEGGEVGFTEPRDAQLARV